MYLASQGTQGGAGSLYFLPFLTTEHFAISEVQNQILCVLKESIDIFSGSIIAKCSVGPVGWTQRDQREAFEKPAKKIYSVEKREREKKRIIAALKKDGKHC